MRRFLQLNPYDFVRFLTEHGCTAGTNTGALQVVFKQDMPHVAIMVRMGEPLQSSVIQAHLQALDIPEERLERYLSRPHRPPDT